MTNKIDTHPSLPEARQRSTPARILLIDDEALIRRSLSDYLNDCGYETVTAVDGADGLNQARAQQFQVVLVDLRMPKIDGLKVVSTLKNEQPELPVVVVSGTGVLSDAIEAIRRGAWDYVTKPIQDMDEIVVVVERVLERARLRTERDQYQRELEQLNRSLEAEVARQVQNLQAQNRELTALNRVSYAISAPLDLDTMLNRAIDAAIAAIEADSGIVRLFGQDHNQLTIAAARGIPKTHYAATQTLPLAEGMVGHVAQTGHPYTHADFVDDPTISLLKDKGFHACLAVPLRAGYEMHEKHHIVGTLEIMLRATHTFDAHEIELLTTIGNQIGVAVARAQYATDLQQANAQLEQLLTQIQEQARQVQQIIDTVPEGVILLNGEGKVILTNPVAAEALASLAKAKTGSILSQLGDQPLTKLLAPPPMGLWHEVVMENQRYEVIARPIETGPSPGGWVMVIRDVTQEREVEQRIQQQERLAAVGQLAAGIAHDFNNLLTVITGYSELMLHRSNNLNDSECKDIEQIHKAGIRATVLTRKLLVFSRQQMIQPQILDLNAIITDMNEMLQRLISENIDLITILNPVEGWITADPGHIEQIIMNLVVNASDAMPRGGKLVIKTTNVDLHQDTLDAHVGLEPGPHVLLSISDTGIGMNAETLTHIFEPFFTTKAKGKGTGLGLSTVYGIVQQNNGHISVSSQPGQGTTFQIYLPRIKEKAETAGRGQTPAESPAGTETILLVEDEDMVRELTRYALRQDGYQVLEASHGKEALKICEQHQGPIHLLLTDIVMPGGMSGRDLANRMVSLRPDTKVLFMSGYADEAIVQQGILTPDIAFLQKPFTPSTLARRVRETLDKF
ncbi:MAG: response regulator [Anaerolineae bacterium]|nr:response regulator [Anaerolineae bacterium]